MTTLLLFTAYIGGILLVILSVRKIVFLLSRERKHAFRLKDGKFECVHCGKSEDPANPLNLNFLPLDQAVCSSKKAPKMKYMDYFWKDANCVELTDEQ